jgi:P-type Cu2+ transporter
MALPAEALKHTPRTAPVACSHCGLPVPSVLLVAGRAEQFCCSGCEAVWHVLRECRLDDYYRLRDAYGDTKAAEPACISGKSFSYLDDPDYLRRYGEPRTAGGYRMRFYLDGVHCIACSWLVEKVLLEREGARFAQLDLGRSILDVVFNPADVKLSALARALDRIGYTPHPLADRNTSQEQRRETRQLLARMGIAAAAAGNIMLLAVSQYAGDASGIDANLSSLFRWVSLGLTLPAVTYSAYPYYRGAWHGLRRGMLHMDLPISLGILTSFAISLVATLQGRGEVYFDSVCGLIFLLLAGRLILQRAARWATDASENLLALAPKSVRRIEDGNERDVLLTDVHRDDVLRVLPGETLPVDGTLDSDEAWLQEAHLTGEPGDVHHVRGESVYAGSAVSRAPVIITATAVGETTRLARLAEMMRESAARRAPIVSLMDRIAGWFVGGVLTLAATTIAIWLFRDPSRAWWNAAALMVVACPCAIGLATPVAFGVAMGRAARRGIYIRRQDAIERLASVTHVILDKTGTLTEGTLHIVEAHWRADLAVQERNDIFTMAAALEKQSGHVAAVAFRDTDALVIAIDNFRVTPGAGVEGTVSGCELHVGSEDFLRSRGIEMDAVLLNQARAAAMSGRTLVCIACAGQAVAVLILDDLLRADAPQTISDLRSLGLSVEILSGDHAQATARVAQELRIETFHGGVSPECKLEHVENLAAKNVRTAMIGDGVNDAAALSRATVGLSAAGAAEVARDAADVFISTARGAHAIAEIFHFARRALRVVRINLVIAVAYNLIGAGLAMTGHVTPLVAAILMPISSLTVLLIATRA